MGTGGDNTTCLFLCPIDWENNVQRQPPPRTPPPPPPFFSSFSIFPWPYYKAYLFSFLFSLSFFLFLSPILTPNYTHSYILCAPSSLPPPPPPPLSLSLSLSLKHIYSPSLFASLSFSLSFSVSLFLSPSLSLSLSLSLPSISFSLDPSFPFSLSICSLSQLVPLSCNHFINNTSLALTKTFLWQKPLHLSFLFSCFFSAPLSHFFYYRLSLCVCQSASISLPLLSLSLLIIDLPQHLILLHRCFKNCHENNTTFLETKTVILVTTSTKQI